MLSFTDYLDNKSKSYNLLNGSVYYFIPPNKAGIIKGQKNL